MKHKADEYLRKIKNNGFLDQLKGTGTSRETQAWITERIIEIILLSEEQDSITARIERLEEEKQTYIRNLSKLWDFDERLRELKLKQKSLGVVIESRWLLVFNLMKAKIDDLIDTNIGEREDE